MRADSAGLGPPFGCQGFSLRAPVRHRVRAIRGHLRAALSRLSQSTPRAAVVLQEEFQVRFLDVGHVYKETAVFQQPLPQALLPFKRRPRRLRQIYADLRQYLAPPDPRVNKLVEAAEVRAAGRSS